jgi:hypothetical protein
VSNWKLGIKQVFLDQVSISVVDETVSPSLSVGSEKVRLQLQLAAEKAGSDLQLKLADVGFSLGGVTVTSGGQTPLKFAQLGFSEGTFDLAERRVGIGPACMPRAANCRLPAVAMASSTSWVCYPSFPRPARKPRRPRARRGSLRPRAWN